MQATNACIGSEDSLIGDFASGCEKPAISRHEDQTIVSISCSGRFGKATTSLLFTGDYTTWYKAQAKTTSKDAGFEKRSGFTIEGKYAGTDCR